MSGASRILVEVGRRDPASDAGAERLARAAQAAGFPLGGVRLTSVYELEPIGQGDAERLARALLVDPVLDEVRLGLEGQAAWPAPGEVVLTVMRRDGVMDPVALSLGAAAGELGLRLERVRTARRVYVRGAGGPPAPAALAFLQRRLANVVVDRVVEGAAPIPAPAPSGPPPQPRREVPLRGLDGPALLALSRRMVLALDEVEMLAVRDHFAGLGRDPSELELETLAQTWSEHCKHKTLAGPVDYREEDPSGRELARRSFTSMLKETVFAATQTLALPRCLSVFSDNAGVISFADGVGVAVKVETHNHPSAIEPYGGAGTGVGGVIRDILGTGLGARPILNLDVFCVGDLDAEPEALPPGTIHPRPLLEGVVAGVRDYGNRMGIPTACGALVTEPRYSGNPLVFCGTVGLIDTDRVGKAARPGDCVVAVGGRTGRDGIHGATFSSDALSSASEAVNGGAVQIGNPIEEKMLLDVLLEVSRRGWLHAVTDCGAGGFSSAVGEMAEGLGADIDLALAPLKYAGLAPWEVWISEAQERMVLAVPPEHLEDVVGAFAAEDVEAICLGTFRDDGLLRVRWGQEVVGELQLEFLHEGLPRQARQAVWRRPAPAPLRVASPPAHAEALRRILAHPTVCSKEWVIRQYDHEVQGGSALKPLVGVQGRGPSDGVAVAPLPGSPQGVVVGLGINPRHGAGDPYAMAAGAVDEALRNLVAAGCDPDSCGILDNYSWGDCRRPEQLGALVRASLGLHDAALAYRVPFISGKDSLNNEYLLPDGTRVAIPGTILVTAVGVIPDVSRLVSMDLKQPGHSVWLVGATRDERLGSLWSEVCGASGGAGPEVDLQQAPELLRRVQRALAAGRARAAHDLAEGGLAVAAAEMAFAGGVGLELDLDDLPGADGLEDAAALFSESPSRLLLEVPPAEEEALARLLDGLPCARIGRTVPEPALRVRRGGRLLLEEPLEQLEDAWRGTLPARYL